MLMPTAAKSMDFESPEACLIFSMTGMQLCKLPFQKAAEIQKFIDDLVEQEFGNNEQSTPEGFLPTFNISLKPNGGIAVVLLATKPIQILATGCTFNIARSPFFNPNYSSQHAQRFFAMLNQKFGLILIHNFFSTENVLVYSLSRDCDGNPLPRAEVG